MLGSVISCGLSVPAARSCAISRLPSLTAWSVDTSPLVLTVCCGIWPSSVLALLGRQNAARLSRHLGSGVFCVTQHLCIIIVIIVNASLTVLASNFMRTFGCPPVVYACVTTQGLFQHQLSLLVSRTCSPN